MGWGGRVLPGFRWFRKCGDLDGAWATHPISQGLIELGIGVIPREFDDELSGMTHEDTAEVEESEAEVFDGEVLPAFGQ